MPALGVFGGTFDPPHIGHAILAAEALHQLALERVLWVLTPAPPHKRGQRITPLAQRLQMVQAAIEGEPRFVLSRADIDRPPPHYALGTVQQVRKTYPGWEVVYLMGGDSLRDLPTWHRPREFVAACDALGVVRRPGDAVALEKVAESLPGLREKVRFVDAPLLQISSRDIRWRVASGRPFRYFLQPKVYAYIQTWGLYLNCA